MPRNDLRILCVHGVGNHPEGGQWERDWGSAIESALCKADPELTAVIEFVHYDDLFKGHRITFWGAVEAAGKLAASGVAALWATPKAHCASAPSGGPPMPGEVV